MKKIITEFKAFAVKGNMLDMAIGIVIGAAFSGIVNSLVKDIINPIFGLVIGSDELKNLHYTLQSQLLDSNGNVIASEVVLKYGSFLSTLLNFLIISFTLFGLMKIVVYLKQKAEDITDTSVKTPKDIELLNDIKELLKKEK